MQTRKRQTGGLPVEVALVWMLFVVVTAEIVVTYSRLPGVYHVSGSGSGIGGGLSRALVFANFPLALVVLALIALLYERLPGPGYRVVAPLCSAR